MNAQAFFYSPSSLMQVCPKLCSRLGEPEPEAHSAMQCEVKNIQSCTFRTHGYIAQWNLALYVTSADCKNYAQKRTTIRLFCASNFTMLHILKGRAQLV
jgi:hypothetical protein